MKLHVEVTQRHIDAGVVNDCYFCPIALAVRIHFQNNYTIWVDNSVVSVESTWEYPKDEDEDYVHLRGNLPHEACDFIRKFDEQIRQVGVKPFSFELELR